jgi:Protein of unknown function (DUF1569)
MGTLWNPTDRSALLDRLAQLSPDTAPRWGHFTAARMLAHLNDAVRMATGELDVAPRRVFLRYPGLKQLAIYVWPFPRGIRTVRELLARTDDADFARERGQFPAMLKQFAARPREGPWPDHPALGRLSGGAWGALTWRHIDHHFRQFSL